MAIPPAEALWKASTYDAGNDRLTDLTGNGHHARLGSAVGADANDPKLLVYAGAKYLYLPGLTGNYASVPDSAALSITGDFDIRVRVAADDWTPGAQKALVSKLNNAGDQGYQFSITSTGFLKVAEDVTAFVSSAATGFTDGAAKWVRARFDADNGSSQREVRFYTANDEAGMPGSWNQLGSNVTAAGVSGPIDHSNPLAIGHTLVFGELLAGKFFRVQVRNNVLDDGTGIVFDVDFNTAAAPYAALLDATGQTVTINRSATGKKAEIVDRDLLLLGTDDYLEVPDSLGLNFGPTASFTLIVALRVYATATADQVFLAKKTSAAAGTLGYVLRRDTTARSQILIADGTFLSSLASVAIPVGVVTQIAGVRSVAADTVDVFQNATGSGGPATDNSVLTLLNAEVLRIGRLSGAGTNYADMSFFGGGVWSQALTVSELAEIAVDFGVSLKRTPSHRRLSQAVKRASVI